MAVEKYQSVQLANRSKVPSEMNYAGDISGKIRFAKVDFQAAVAGDANSTIDFAAFPPGRIRLLLGDSEIAWSAFGAGRLLDFGYRAFRKVDGTTEVADPDAFDNDIDISAAGTAFLGSDLPAANPLGDYVITSQNGFILFGTVAGGTVPLNATIEGNIFFVAE